MKKSIVYAIIALMLLPFSILAQGVEVKPLPINSSSDDFAPSLSRNGKSMFISSERKRGKQKEFFVEKTSNGWELVGTTGDEINDGSQSGSATLTPDGQYMIFAAYEHGVKGEGRTDLYSAKKVKGEWKDVQNLGAAINSPYWDSQPSLSSDGTTLYFVSDRPGGYGGTDIYLSKKTREGWSRAVNVGTGVNSSSNEMAPVLAYDNLTMSFASDMPGGLGGLDIYFTRVSGSTFTALTNPGAPINSPEDDAFYYIQANSNIAYFASNRPGGEGGLDVYSAVPNPHQSKAVVSVEGVVRDAVTRDPLGCDIVVTDLKTRTRVASLHSDDVDGSYYAVLQAGNKYSITASKKGYVFYSQTFNIPENEKGSTKTKDIDLYPLKGGKTQLLVFFDFNKSNLQDESIPELERMIEFLNDNPELKFRLEGHTDDVGSDDYNNKLSLDRTITVKNYLIKAGIDKDRIETIGYGESRPIIKETTEEARAANRRVEMIIIE